MKYKAGDKVRIKSLEWYKENRNISGDIAIGDTFFRDFMSPFCGSVVTIESIELVANLLCYRIKEDGGHYCWVDEMIEGLVEEEVKPKFKIGDKITNGKHHLTILNLTPDKYIVKDELGHCGIVFFTTRDNWELVEEETKFGTASNPIEIKSNANCLTQERADEINKPKPKFKVGDKVILDPYPCVVTDVNWKDSLHGFVYTVRGTDFGKMVGEEDLVFDERTFPNTDKIIKSIKADWTNFKDRWDIPNEYHFVDKNGNEIDISEIVLEKKKEYPKTYEECSKIAPMTWGGVNFKHYNELLSSFCKLLICRDAYWKIAGEEMGLGKPWKPDWTNINEVKFIIGVSENEIIKCCNVIAQYVLAFPTAEMRDAFKENFDPDIEICKELL